MLQTIKYPVGTQFKVTNGESVIKVLKIDGKGKNSRLTLKYTQGKEGIFVYNIDQVDNLVGFKSWIQINNNL